MAMTKPGVRPAVPHFSSGPCAKRPSWSLQALTDAVLAGGHPAEAIADIAGFMRRLALDETVAIDADVAASERDTGFRNASLGNFLADPSKAVPGTAMSVNLTDAQQRDDVIAYLKAQSPGAN